jgi:hypothetical protein
MPTLIWYFVALGICEGGCYETKASFLGLIWAFIFAWIYICLIVDIVKSFWSKTWGEGVRLRLEEKTRNALKIIGKSFLTFFSVLFFVFFLSAVMYLVISLFLFSMFS